MNQALLIRLLDEDPAFRRAASAFYFGLRRIDLGMRVMTAALVLGLAALVLCGMQILAGPSQAALLGAVLAAAVAGAAGLRIDALRKKNIAIMATFTREIQLSGAAARIRSELLVTPAGFVALAVNESLFRPFMFDPRESDRRQTAWLDLVQQIEAQL